MTREDVIRSIMDNCPECSENVPCVKWRYDECIFQFRDPEDNRLLTLDMQKLLIAFDKIKDQFRYPGDVCSDNEIDEWLCNQDAVIVDTLVQTALYGEVVFG